MRVALISYHTSPLAWLGSSAAGGMNVYVRRLAEGLAERDVEVDVFTRRECVDCDREQEFTPGARLITVRAGPTRIISKSELAGYAHAFARNLACYVGHRNLQYDVVHSHYWLSGLAAQAMRNNRQPLVHMFHTLGRVKRDYQPDAGDGDPPSRDYGERTLLKSDHTLVFSTEAEVDDVERLYGVRPRSTAIIPPGVDSRSFAPMDSGQARKTLGLGPGPIILFVGRMDRAKGVDLLLQAVASMRERTQDESFQLVIVGGDDRNRDAVAHRELERLRAIVGDLGLSAVVRFEGVIQQNRLPLYYAACDVCVVPSRYESFGMVALEALSSGRPVAGFRSPGLEQTVIDGVTGALVPSGDVEALGAAIESILAEPGKSASMGAAAREAAKRFSWERVADDTTELYAGLLAEVPAALELRSS